MSKTDTVQAAVDIDRLKADLLALSNIGRNESDHGIYRMAFTEADIQARQWLLGRMEEAGMTARMDGAANVIGRWPQENTSPAVLLGSHIDSVPCGGHLDGSLGVVAGLECVRAVREAGIEMRHPVEVIAFSDEEGRFGGMFGAQAFCGRITPETLFTACDLDNVLLSDAMKARGFDPNRALDAHRDPQSIRAYLELHIEQGPVLDQSAKQVGIVEEITGLFRWNARLIGRPNHAGTTPMNLRADAFLGLAEFANAIPRLLEENGSEHSRATIGNVGLLPGSANTIPGRADFSLDVRDVSPLKLNELHDAFRKALSAIARRRGLRFEFEEVSRIEPVVCDPQLVELLTRQAGALGLNGLRMPSGAAHDAQIMASVAPVAMIFVPSREGRSHSPAEWTSWSDIEAGANLLLRAAVEMAGEGLEDGS